MIEQRLSRQLEKAAGRYRHLRLVIGWSLVWIAVAAAAAAVLLFSRAGNLHWPSAVPVLGSLAVVGAIVVAWFACRSARNYQWVARKVEATYPELQAGLLAAVDQEPQLAGGRFSYLQANVIHQALRHAYEHPWQQVVPGSRLLSAHLANLAGLALLVGALAALHAFQRQPQLAATQPSTIRLAAAGANFQVTVEPGNTEVERGTSLLVLARFAETLPLEATLVYQTRGEQTSLPMIKSLDDPVYGGRVVEVNEPLTYRVEFAGQASEDFQVQVFEYPKLVRADARLTFPEYTSQAERLVQDVLRISAVEGTRLRLLCYLNKPVAEARLVPTTGEPITLALSDEATALYTTEMVLKQSLRMELHLVDREGRKNKQPDKFVITVLPNKPPDLKLVQPVRDLQVSPLEELDLKANVWDDFGVARFGLAYSLGADEPLDVVLGESAPAKQRTPVEHLVAFEELGAEPDQLLSYHFWAEDIGPDGQPRRVASDMFFAEVRHFEEIFRQGQQPPGGEQQQQQQQQQNGGNAQAAQQLAELQKQIVSGTWKVIRRETGTQPTTAFADDVALLAESQATAIGQAEALAERLQDPESLGHVEQVRKHMAEALDRLTQTKNSSAPSDLRGALPPEQAAYQALLKLRAREHEVIRSQQQRSQSRGRSGPESSRQQQQLQQLDLSSNENRYETEQQARSQEQEQSRENRQVLNRLQELARRQGDLNERLKELQSALEEAKSVEEREEIQRQLQRLREEQQRILRDTEELQERMEQEQNLERMAEAREQLEQTRENVRQASEALEEGRVSRALASGARAERELQELREDFRRQTSGQFEEEMRQMRQSARELEQNQQRLSEQLSRLNQPNQTSGQTPSLRDTGEREEALSEMEQQTQRLQQLLDQMRETIFEAEEPEPLLADQLYNTVRQAQQQELDQRLNNARRMLEYGFLDDARREERQARSGITNLREGIEQAAERVLGDETEALRRAREELERLRNQLEQELDRAVPGRRQQQAGREQREADAEGQPQDGQGRPPADARESTEGQQESPRGQGERRGAQSPSGQQPSQDEQQQGRQGGGEQPTDDSERQPGEAARENGEQAQGGSPQESQQEGQPSNQRGQNGQQNQRPAGSSGEQEGSPRNTEGSNRQQAGQPSQQDRQGGRNSRGGFDRLIDAGGPGRGLEQASPILGEDYRQWADRMRDVEEMIGDPELRAEAARIRDRVRGFRAEVKRHSKEPQWDLLESQVLKPMAELTDRVAEEILRRTSQEARVPLDRDPVPSRFSEQVRRYYEQLGSGK